MEKGTPLRQYSPGNGGNCGFDGAHVFAVALRCLLAERAVAGSECFEPLAGLADRLGDPRVSGRLVDLGDRRLSVDDFIFTKGVQETNDSTLMSSRVYVPNRFCVLSLFTDQSNPELSKSVDYFLRPELEIVATP
jgi:hypothetical protein